jgi:uncharacterized damage-inducible protein DinB
MTDPRYPVGQFDRRSALTPDERRKCMQQIAEAPPRMREAVRGLSDEQLDTPYREGGWTLRQVVHHVPDSHLNGYCRHKLALTEDEPAIRPYDEAAWATLTDSQSTPVEVSLTLLDSLHARWTQLWTAMRDDDFARRLHHPDSGAMTLDALLGLYAWHGRHHVAHITALRERMGW